MDVLKNELDILKEVSRILMKNHIPFMITGSMAMNYYAIPRMTRDIDIVVDTGKNEVQDIVKLFAADYYISEEAVLESISSRSMFNIIHNESIIKVDFIIRKDTEYRRVEFERRQLITINDFKTYIVSKEDLILSKMLWAKDSQFDYQFNDIKNLMETGFDTPYVHKWVVSLGIKQLYRVLRDE